MIGWREWIDGWKDGWIDRQIDRIHVHDLDYSIIFCSCQWILQMDKTLKKKLNAK